MDIESLQARARRAAKKFSRHFLGMCRVSREELEAEIVGNLWEHPDWNCWFIARHYLDRAYHFHYGCWPNLPRKTRHPKTNNPKRLAHKFGTGPGSGIKARFARLNHP